MRDGFYNFRIKNLRKKWEEVSAMLPKTFEKEDLTEFFSYMQAESDKKVYLDKNSLYDEHFKKLDLSTLLSAEGDIIKEIILSNSAEIIIKRNSFCGDAELSGIKEYLSKKISLHFKSQDFGTIRSKNERKIVPKTVSA